MLRFVCKLLKFLKWLFKVVVFLFIEGDDLKLDIIDLMFMVWVGLFMIWIGKKLFEFFIFVNDDNGVFFEIFFEFVILVNVVFIWKVSVFVGIKVFVRLFICKELFLIVV